MQIPTRITVFYSLIAVGLLALPVHAYEEMSVTGGGTITGKVVYNGPVPTRMIVVTKDQEVCGGIREEPEILVAADKGVQEVVIQLVKVAKGKAWADVAPKRPALDNVKCRFEPHVQVIPAGKLDIVNSDPVLHNTHGYYGRRTAFNVALPNKDQRIEAELVRAGTVRVDCDAHGWMEAWIYVVDNPYYAITSEDGSFTIGDVPPGEYTMVATHELTGAVETMVTVKAGELTDATIELKK